jgi:hypothetical protein
MFFEWKSLSTTTTTTTTTTKSEISCEDCQIFHYQELCSKGEVIVLL